MTAEAITAQRRRTLFPGDQRELIPVEEVALMFDVSVALLKRQHLADPVNYPAQRIGVLWRIPRWWVEQKIECFRVVTS